MKNLNHKTGLGRKAVAVMALTAAVAATLASAPASAYQSYSISGDSTRVHTEQFLGHGNTKAKALADARRDMRCIYGKKVQRFNSGPTYRSMYNNTWFNATVYISCSGSRWADDIIG